MPEDAPPAAPPKTPFAVFLQEQKRGSVHAEATTALADLVAACKALGKKGSMRIDVVIDPAKDGLMMAVTTEVSVKEPKPTTPAAMFFASDAGQLTKTHPGQMPLLKEAPSPDAQSPEAQGGAA